MVLRNVEPENRYLETMKITREEVEHVARLARLELQPDEVERITEQLDTILRYAAKLDQVDTEGVATTTHTQDVRNAFREDEVRDSLDRDQALANAPRRNDAAFVVPRIIS